MALTDSAVAKDRAHDHWVSSLTRSLTTKFTYWAISLAAPELATRVD